MTEIFRLKYNGHTPHLHIHKYAVILCRKLAIEIHRNVVNIDVDNIDETQCDCQWLTQWENCDTVTNKDCQNIFETI